MNLRLGLDLFIAFCAALTVACFARPGFRRHCWRALAATWRYLVTRRRCPDCHPDTEPPRRGFHGPRWQPEALAVAASLSDEEWEARRRARMAPGHPERPAGSETDAEWDAVVARLRPPQPRDGGGR
jgi:hypothetical protein